MKRNYLTYPLTDGFVDDWLVLGPHDRLLEERPAPAESQLAFRTRILEALDYQRPDFQAPMESERETFGDQSCYWTVAHCEADHLLDWSDSSATYTHRRAWAFVGLSSAAAGPATLQISTTCPATLWLNGKLVGRCEQIAELADQTPHSRTFTVALKAANNALLVRLDQVVLGPAALAFAVRVRSEAGKPVRAKAPTVTKDVKQRVAMERAFQHAYTDRAVCPRDAMLRVVGADDAPGRFQSVMRTQTPDGWIYGESFGSVGPGTTIAAPAAVQLPSGPMQARLMPPHEIYYEGQLRAERRLAFWVANQPFAQTPDATPEERLVDALRQASRGDDIYAQLANMAAGWWGSVNPKAIDAAIRRVAGRQYGCLSDLLGLIIVQRRMAGNEQFPADLRPALEEAITGFDYGATTEGNTVAAAPNGPSLTESEQIQLYTCRVLAGQLFPKARFSVSGLTGREERSRGEKQTLAWLRARGQGGFNAWNTDVDAIITALAQLTDLAEDDQVIDLAAVLLDKSLFSIALQSHRGTFGGSCTDVEPTALRSGRFAAQSGIGRLLWGVGGYQSGLRAAVSLALASENYQLPGIIGAIATDLDTAVWARERQGTPASSGGASTSALPPPAALEVNTVTYRTADFLLCSAQDFRPGERGRKEHIWQATLGPEALVFTNHPTSFSESAVREAGWWRGNGSLPRVAQWKDTLIALYDLPANAWLRFTHAYFPLYAFSEHLLAEGWAFARVEDAYLALYASQPFELMRRGPDAHRELRAAGLRTAWLCQMGARDTDTSFENFQRRVIASRPTIEGLRVTWQTIREERLEFDWSGPLLLNGQQQPIAGFKHHESIYGAAEFPAQTMDIAYGQDLMRLNFG